MAGILEKATYLHVDRQNAARRKEASFIESLKYSLKRY